MGLRVAVKSANTCCLPAGGRRADRLLLAGRGAGGECRYLSSKPSHWGLEYADAPVPECPPLLLLPSPGLPCPCRSCQASLSDTPPPPPPPCRELPRPRAAQAPPNGKLQPTPGSLQGPSTPMDNGDPHVQTVPHLSLHVSTGESTCARTHAQVPTLCSRPPGLLLSRPFPPWQQHTVFRVPATLTLCVPSPPLCHQTHPTQRALPTRSAVLKPTPRSTATVCQAEA